MKNLFKIKIIIALIAITFFAISCNNDDESMADNTITGIAQTNANLSILVQALVKADLASTLQGVGPFTVFAPTDAAFVAFLKTTPYATLNDVPKDVLTQILLNHVVSGKKVSTDLTTGYVKTLAKSATSGTNTMSMYVNTASGVKLNGVAMVTSADIMASNGVIHVVDKVIGLPTIVTHATANANFTSLVGALTSAGQPNFVSILSGTGPFTVMAPTNAAFTDLNTELAPGGTASVSVANLTKVLTYHVANGNVLAASLMEGQEIATLQLPQKYTIQLTGRAKIKDVRNRISTIVATDVQCSNGVIHVINKVLLPTF
ncbi:fasciclin domain-containing protein [Flavobacterium franklandianum]|uniref:Fasciclin domain-containing protein n=1 Tax=Flavobacterium franklandianum TaxID=2594430 RepID=A0A553CN95_9FLAO|nr:fasciclin domain-containing protein [Flavobacterium franklandianum]TRX22002.1 fasciclin domain-containing protein [Flavobacterium franklandianum]